MPCSEVPVLGVKGPVLSGHQPVAPAGSPRPCLLLLRGSSPGQGELVRESRADSAGQLTCELGDHTAIVFSQKYLPLLLSSHSSTARIRPLVFTAQGQESSVRYGVGVQAASLPCSPAWQAHQMQLLPCFTGLTLPHPGKMLPMTKAIVLKYAVLLSL